MSAVFTPGLKVTDHIIVSKDRRLPLEGDVLVSVGDLVKADDVVARTELPGKVYPVNIANQLGVDPGSLKGFMKFAEGDRVEKDVLVAETDGIFGFFKSEARAIVSGTIKSIRAQNGDPVEYGQILFVIDQRGAD